MNNKYNEQRITRSKKACECSETGNHIQKGEKILFVPEGKETYSKDSSKFKTFAIADNSLLCKN